jgi:hypothetical protein
MQHHAVVRNANDLFHGCSLVCSCPAMVLDRKTDTFVTLEEAARLKRQREMEVGPCQHHHSASDHHHDHHEHHDDDDDDHHHHSHRQHMAQDNKRDDHDDDGDGPAAAAAADDDNDGDAAAAADDDDDYAAPTGSGRLSLRGGGDVALVPHTTTTHRAPA